MEMRRSLAMLTQRTQHNNNRIILNRMFGELLMLIPHLYVISTTYYTLEYIGNVLSATFRTEQRRPDVGHHRWL